MSVFLHGAHTFDTYRMSQCISEDKYINYLVNILALDLDDLRGKVRAHSPLHVAHWPIIAESSRKNYNSFFIFGIGSL